MKTSRLKSVAEWTRILGKALLDVEDRRMIRDHNQYVRKMNAQANSIRSWDLGEGAPASLNGWRLLK